MPIDDSNHADELRAEGLAELKLGHYRRARRTLEKALAAKPGSKRLRHDLGKVHLAAGQPEAALAELDQIPDAVSHSEIMWKDRALAQLLLGDPDEALACAERSL
nr:tetratricopeptide repeat protein [Candidatus Poseidoniia archaeon]